MSATRPAKSSGCARRWCGSRTAAWQRRAGSELLDAEVALPLCCAAARANRLPDRRDRGDALSPRRGRRIVGVSGYAVRPPRVRREKPRVSAFISADVPKILALEPDLVLTFSDLQADIAAELIRDGVAVHAFNQRDIAGIFAMIRTLGALVGARDKADALAASLAARGSRSRAARRAAAAPAARLFRGMGRADDLRHRLGVGAGRGGRRHRRVPGAGRAERAPRTASSRPSR